MNSCLFTYYKVVKYSTDQSTENKEDHEYATERRLAHDVTVANGCHGDEHEIHALPVGERLRVAEIHKRISRILQLNTVINLSHPL